MLKALKLISRRMIFILFLAALALFIINETNPEIIETLFTFFNK